MRTAMSAGPSNCPDRVGEGTPAGPRRGREPHRRGAVAVLVAVSMVVLIGVMALVLDAGLLMIERREAQAAADAAALAASQALAKEGGDLAKARAAAQSFAAANGFPAGASLALAVDSPPASGPFAGDGAAVEVRLAHASPRFFSGIWGDGAMTASARAVAWRSDGGDGAARLLLLDPGRSEALVLTGGGRIVSDAGVQVNSAHATAVVANNTGSIQPRTAGKANTPVTRIAGGYTDQPWSKIQGRVVTGAAPVADPLAGLPEPSLLGTVFSSLALPQYGSYTLYPGVYVGGLNLGHGVKFTMQPGRYYMLGGSFTVANGAALKGHGVLIYVDALGGSFNFQGGGVIDLSPMTSGPFAGVTMYQSRLSPRDISIANGTTTTIAGTIYAPNARVKFAGGASYAQYGDRFIARSMEVSNNAGIGFGGGGAGLASAPRHTLVE